MEAGWFRGRKLGKGGYGDVYEAVPLKPGELMAVKSAPEHKANSLFAEEHFLNKLSGVPGIIHCYGGEFTGENPRTYNLLIEHAPCGNLYELIDYYSSGDGFGIPEGFLRVFTRSLLKSLSSIHSRRIAHCDIKPGNILVFKPPPGGGKHDFELKIADFGLAVEVSDGDEGGVCDYRGTVEYMPPEMVNFNLASPAMDVWALGCTVLEMVTGDQVWKGWRSKEDGLKIMIGMGNHPEIPEWLCEEGKDFLRLCFEKCSSWRASCRELLRHPFVDGGDGGGEEDYFSD
ncbi:Mitogen-activated protein kinase kinase kinase 20 [Linum perenne]